MLKEAEAMQLEDDLKELDSPTGSRKGADE